MPAHQPHRSTTTARAGRAAALTLVGALALGACGRADGGTGPGSAAGAAFDAARVSAASGAARDVFAIPVLAAVLTQGPRFVQISGPPVAGTPNVTPVPGATYVRSANGLYVRDPARTGAPPNGARYVIRAADAAGTPTGPELGWADVTTDAATGARRVTVSDGRATVYASELTGPATTGAGSSSTPILTALSGTAGTGDGAITFRATTTLEAGTLSVPGLTLSGGASAAAAQLFGLGIGRVATVTTASTAGATFEARTAVPLRAGDVARTAITVAGRALTLEQPAVPYAGPLALPAVLGPVYMPSDTTRVALDGAPFGYIVRPPLGRFASMRFSRTDGSPMSADEQRGVLALVQAGGSLPSVSVIGVLVELWRLQIAG